MSQHNHKHKTYDHFGGMMDLNALSFLWAVLLLPLGWLFKMLADMRKESKSDRAEHWKAINALGDKLNEIDKKADRGVSEKRVREIMKEEMEPVRGDIRALQQSVNNIPLTLQASIHALELKLIEKAK